MRMRKPNRLSTPRWAVLNGTRAGHASMPRARSRWWQDPACSQATPPGRNCPPEDGTPGSAPATTAPAACG